VWKLGKCCGTGLGEKGGDGSKGLVVEGKTKKEICGTKEQRKKANREGQRFPSTIVGKVRKE